MKSFILRFLLGVFALGFIATSGFAQTHSGAIKALKVSGTVSRIDSAGVTSPVTDGTALAESDTIVTGADSGVVLVFMNGSSVKLGANSRLLVEQFKMDPLAGDINVATLKKEPSVSQTTLNLAYGELVGDVKKLNSSSTYNIKTAVGAAGIRGTTFRIVLTPSADGKTFAFTLSTTEGLVVVSFTGSTATAPVEVGQGTEVTATAEINTTTGTTTSTSVTTGGISDAASAAINTAITEAIQQAQDAGFFTTAEQQAAGSETSSEAPAAGAEADTGTTTEDAPVNQEPVVTEPVSPS